MNRHQLVARLALERNAEGDFDVAVGIQAMLGAIEFRRRALDQVVVVALPRGQFQGHSLEVDPGGVFDLSHIPGCDSGLDSVGLTVGIHVLPLLRLGADVLRQISRFGDRQLLDQRFLGSIRRANAAEDSEDGDQQEPAGASHGV